MSMSYRSRSLIFAAAALISVMQLPAAADDSAVTGAQIVGEAASPNAPGLVAQSKDADNDTARKTSEVAPGLARSMVSHRTHRHKRLVASGGRVTWLAWSSLVRSCPPSCSHLLMLGVGF
jgi:hypothetical protein